MLQRPHLHWTFSLRAAHGQQQQQQPQPKGPLRNKTNTIYCIGINKLHQKGSRSVRVFQSSHFHHLPVGCKPNSHDLRGTHSLCQKEASISIHDSFPSVTAACWSQNRIQAYRQHQLQNAHETSSFKIPRQFIASQEADSGKSGGSLKQRTCEMFASNSSFTASLSAATWKTPSALFKCAMVKTSSVGHGYVQQAHHLPGLSITPHSPNQTSSHVTQVPTPEATSKSRGCFNFQDARLPQMKKNYMCS